MSLVTEISAITVIHVVSVLGKAAENAGKFENVTGIMVLKGDRSFPRKFCVDSVFQFKHATAKFPF